MTKKKAGKILVLSTIPHFLLWLPVGVILDNPEKHYLPSFMLWWLLGILSICATGIYISKNLTPKDTWKSIVDFINE